MMPKTLIQNEIGSFRSQKPNKRRVQPKRFADWVTINIGEIHQTSASLKFGLEQQANSTAYPAACIANRLHAHSPSRRL